MHALHVIYSMEYRMLYCHRRLMYFFSTEQKNSTDDDSIFIFRRLSCNLFSNRRFRRFRSTQRSTIHTCRLIASIESNKGIF